MVQLDYSLDLSLFTVRTCFAFVVGSIYALLYKRLNVLLNLKKLLVSVILNLGHMQFLQAASYEKSESLIHF